MQQHRWNNVTSERVVSVSPPLPPLRRVASVKHLGGPASTTRQGECRKQTERKESRVNRIANRKISTNDESSESGEREIAGVR